MNLIKIIFVLFVFFFNISNSYATNIVTINLDNILNNNIQFQNYLLQISEHKKNKQKTLDIEEKNLLIKKKEIENLELIFSKSEIEKHIGEFNNSIKIFSNKINAFNEFYIKNLEVNETIMLDKIVLVLKKISLLNNYDVVINQNNFLIANEDIDISDDVINELSKINFKFRIPND